MRDVVSNNIMPIRPYCMQAEFNNNGCYIQLLNERVYISKTVQDFFLTNTSDPFLQLSVLFNSSSVNTSYFFVAFGNRPIITLEQMLEQPWNCIKLPAVSWLTKKLPYQFCYSLFCQIVVTHIKQQLGCHCGAYHETQFFISL